VNGFCLVLNKRTRFVTLFASFVFSFYARHVMKKRDDLPLLKMARVPEGMIHPLIAG
jgi:hypothetical protein